LAAVQRRRADGELTQDEQDIRTNILAGLIDDKGGEQQIGTAERILAEIISGDVALLVVFNQAIDGVLKNNSKGQISPHANVRCRPQIARRFQPVPPICWLTNIGVGPPFFSP
jgi:hypothetical protein